MLTRSQNDFVHAYSSMAVLWINEMNFMIQLEQLQKISIMLGMVFKSEILANFVLFLM